MTDSFTVRTTSLDDIVAITELLVASYPVLMQAAYHTAILHDALPVMTRANPKLLASGTFYIAEYHCGRVVGCGGWSVEKPGSGAIEDGVAHIRHFGVHPEVAGCGVGRAIMGACIRAAKATGIKRLECYSSLNAEAFYAALGFQSVTSFDVWLGGKIPFPSIAMVREI